MKIVEKDTVDGYLKARDHHCCKIRILESRWTLSPLLDLLKAGATVILRNAKIDMFKGSMRLAVDKWGRVKVTEPADFTVKEDNNLSMIEYELVNVADE
ncbi:hypothetical protein ACJRO7_022986 [Eucalyptus globulus]|uniref:Single-stranded DNA binding protein Ssb-like OB fold domain-containing protein n=1 Tax=Eucalyptus globulus TaxID=34317 RepID=A0ABD3K095_EUCGL